jgi:imidazolonepropionase-like amidohydrolase
LLASGSSLDATLAVYARPLDPKRTAAPPCTVELAGAITKAAHRAGVPIVAGTDVDAGPAEQFPMLYKELALLVTHAGLSPMEAIVSATRNPARMLGKDNEIGTIEAGKLANMMLVREDPTRDVANLRSVVMTVKRGKQFQRADYKHVAEDLK